MLIDPQVQFNQVFFCRSVHPELLSSFLYLHQKKKNWGYRAVFRKLVIWNKGQITLSPTFNWLWMLSKCSMLSEFNSSVFLQIPFDTSTYCEYHLKKSSQCMSIFWYQHIQWMSPSGIKNLVPDIKSEGHVFSWGFQRNVPFTSAFVICCNMKQNFWSLNGVRIV